jgi:soluble lytic murein transglycosylase-like protein
MPRRAGFAVLALAAALAAAPAAAQVYTRTNANGVIEATNFPSPGYRLTYPGKGTLIHSRGFRGGAYRGEFDPHIEAAASTYGVAPELVRAVIRAESEFDVFAVSSKGAQGLMQLMPATARRFGVSDPFDPRQNIFAGTQYLRILLDLFDGDVALALAGYNAGENAVRRYKGIPPYRETRGYVTKVQSYLGAATYPLATRAASSYAPAGGVRRAASRPARRQPPAPLAPRVYYRYHDARGILTVSQEPPDEGVTYSLIRAGGR